MGKTYGIDFQPYSKELAAKLREILELDLRGTENFLIGLPYLMSSYGGYPLHKVKFWSTYNLTKRKWLLDHLYEGGEGQCYGSSFLARVNGIRNYCKEEFWTCIDDLQQIWSGRSVLIVEGEHTCLGVGTDLLFPAKNITRILIPDKDAFSRYGEVMERIQKREKPELILLVAGPMATIMAWDLYQIGCWVIDLGQIHAGYMQASLKHGGYRYPILSEEGYRKQIVDRVKPEGEP